VQDYSFPIIEETDLTILAFGINIVYYKISNDSNCTILVKYRDLTLNISSSSSRFLQGRGQRALLNEDSAFSDKVLELAS